MTDGSARLKKIARYVSFLSAATLSFLATTSVVHAVAAIGIAVYVLLEGEQQAGFSFFEAFAMIVAATAVTAVSTVLAKRNIESLLAEDESADYRVCSRVLGLLAFCGPLALIFVPAWIKWQSSSVRSAFDLQAPKVRPESSPRVVKPERLWNAHRA